MSHQQRMMLAVALCGAIYFVWQVVFPPPPLPSESETPDVAAVQDEAKPEAGLREDQVEPEAADPSQDLAVEEHVVKNDLLAITLSNRSPTSGGIVVGTELLSDQFQGHTTATNAFGLDGAPTLEVSFADAASDLRIPASTRYAVEDWSDTHVTFVHHGATVEVVQRFEILSGYQARLEVTVKNTGGAPQAHVVHVSTRFGLAVESSYDVQRGLCRMADDLEEEDRGDVEDKPARFQGVVRWGGVDSKYFGTLVVPTAPAAACEIRRSDDGHWIVNDLISARVELPPGASHGHTFGIYLGPKEIDRLRDFQAVPMAVPGELEQAIDWGWLGFLSESLGELLLAMLRWLFDMTRSWGVSIVLLTIVVKVLTLPLTLKQMASMRAMKRIQPELDAIKAKYSDDLVKRGQEQQALMSRAGVNPFAGCLPQLVQLPVWLALYTMLGAVVELVHVPFLWLPDLTQQDPYYILPLAIGGLMVLQSRLMPMSMGDETQAQMMRWMMPVMFTGLMLFVPSGLGLYIFVNSTLSILQTAVQVGRKGDPAPAAK